MLAATSDPDPADLGNSTPGPGRAVTDPVAYLAGTWRLERTIDDHRADQRGQVTGQATFVAFPDGSPGLRWREEGTLRLGDYVGDASRELHVVPGPDGWEVRFDDGRPFHPLDLTRGAVRVDHPCRADHYRGTITAVAADRWEIDWRVTGPAKDLTIRTRYVR